MSKLIQVLKDACDQLDILKEEIINLEKKYQRLKQREFIDAVKSIKAQNHSEPPQIGDKYIITLEDIYDGDVDTVYGISGCDVYIDEYQLEKLQRYRPEKESVEDAYQRGINDAWDAARKIVRTEGHGGISSDEVEKIFGSWHLDQVFNLSAQEAMAKLRAYEQREKYKAGDIVKDKDGKVYMCYGADDASVTMGNGKEVLIIPAEFNKAYTLCYNVFDDSMIGDYK